VLEKLFFALVASLNGWDYRDLTCSCYERRAYTIVADDLTTLSVSILYYYYYYLFTAFGFAPGGSSPTLVQTKTIKQHYTIVQHNTIKSKHEIIRT
jgi:hypothetical protein